MCNLSKLLFACACALAFSSPALAGHIKVVHTFKGGAKDGMRPLSSLTPDGQGNFYGTTQYGGSNQECGGEFGELGCGTVFRLAADGTETIFHAFKGGADGAHPYASVAIGPDGAIYGTTAEGGGLGDCYIDGCGTVFRITPAGQESVIHSFGAAGDGRTPNGRLVIDKTGHIFGTTIYGGDGCVDGCGTVFEISAKGKETVLHAFLENGHDGIHPYAGLALYSNGLYGTTSNGGTGNQGTVFKVTMAGVESVLYSFNGTDGAEPSADLLVKSGNLYGTTAIGGEHNDGEVFKLTQAGQFTVLYSFKGNIGGDGAMPLGGVVSDGNGNLYGTLWWNDCCGSGYVYRIAHDGTETLYPIPTRDGYDTLGTLVSDDLGNFYGVNYQGGSSKGACGDPGCGTVFRFTP